MPSRQALDKTQIGMKSSHLAMVYLVFFVITSAIALFVLEREHQIKKQEMRMTMQVEMDKHMLFNRIVNGMGYGNFIHSFKNYVIRGETDYRSESYSKKIDSDYQTVMQAIDRYASMSPLSQEETTALEAIKQTLNEYYQRLEDIRSLKAAGGLIADIDSKVVVDDRPAMAAIKQWSQYLNKTTDEAAKKVLSQSQGLSSKLLGIVLLILIVANILAFIFIFRNRLIRPLQKFSTQLLAADVNELDSIIRTAQDISGSCEVNLLVHNLGSALSNLKEAENEATSIRHVVDQSTANIMIANEDLVIMYMNDAIIRTLRTVEADIQKMLPHFSTDNLVGQNIDIFHVNPQHQRQLLKNLQDTYIAKLTLGELHLEIIVNPLFDNSGQRDGFVTEWKDVTQQHKLEKMQENIEQKIKSLVVRASEGYMGEQIDLNDMDGFILDLSQQINQMIQAISNANQRIRSVIDSLSKGDLTSRITESYKADMADMKEAINQSLDTLSKTLSQTMVAIESISQDMHQTAERNIALSSRIQQQAASIEQTAATMEQMTASIRNNADNAKVLMI